MSRLKLILIFGLIFVVLGVAGIGLAIYKALYDATYDVSGIGSVMNNNGVYLPKINEVTLDIKVNIKGLPFILPFKKLTIYLKNDKSAKPYLTMATPQSFKLKNGTNIVKIQGVDMTLTNLVASTQKNLFYDVKVSLFIGSFTFKNFTV